MWLDPALTSPYAFYQFWLNQADADVLGYLKVFTFLSRERLDELERAVADEPFKREAQRVLAFDVTSLVHGPDAAAAVVEASQAIFGRGELGSLDAATLAGVAQEVPSAEVSARLDGGRCDGFRGNRGVAFRRPTGDRGGRCVRQQRAGRRRGPCADAQATRSRAAGLCSDAGKNLWDLFALT